MKTVSNILLGLLVTSLFLLNGCSSGGGNDSGSTVSQTTILSGVAQKGAFLKGSVVALCKLDEKMLCTSDKLEIKVSDDKGSYEFKALSWSGLSRLTISGYYFDELTGKKSLSPATITAIVDIESKVRQERNTNLLTDLRAKRMKVLVEKGKSLEDAKGESKEDIKKLFNVTSDDFTELNLVDFTQGKASVNVELLRLSAAVANAQDPVATLEELMKIYNKYGIEAVLNSTLYKELMGLIQRVDVKEVLTKMTSAQEANAINITDIAPFAIANVVTYGNINYDSKVRVTLIGTEFIDAPSISLTSSDESITISSITLSDDNRSALLEMSKATSCLDVNLTFTVDYLSLKEVENPIRTNRLTYKDDTSFCTSIIADDNVNTQPIIVDPTAIISLVPLQNKQIKLTLLGTEFENYTALTAELITTSDTLAIVDTKVADNNKSVVFTLNEATNYCADNNVSIGLYTFNLKGVANESDTFKSNKIKYVSPNTLAQCGGNDESTPVSFNRAPTVSITQNPISIEINTVLELDAVADDVNSADTVTLQWAYKIESATLFKPTGTNAHFSHLFTIPGNYKVIVVATDNQGAESNATIEFEVVDVNHAPTVRISPSGDKNITIGESVLLKSIAEDEDGDPLTISWKIKEQNDSSFSDVDLYGLNGFSYTFDSLGIYLVVAEVEDSKGSTADANITVKVNAVAPVTVTLADININVVVKGTTPSETTNGSSDVLDVNYTNPEHGIVDYFKIGNEVPAFTYTSTDCFIGKDSFIYKSGDEYGRVNVTITSASSLQLLSETKTLFSTETIIGEYLRAKSAYENVTITTQTHGGSSSLTVVGNEIINYNYDPDDSFVGNDYFEYSVSETINQCSYSQIGRIDFVVEEALGKVHLFTWYDAAHGYEVWRTDGTVAKTSMVKDIRPGTDGGGSVDSAVEIDGIHYFTGNDGNHSSELWRTDGTESGTYMVKDINPGANDGSFPYNLSVIGKTIYFFGMSGDNNGSNWLGSKGIWKSDGTETGTVLIEDFGDFSLTSFGAPGYLQAFGNKLIFAKDDAAGGGYQWEPWISDGSSSASKLKDIWPGDDGSGFIGCIEMNSKCYSAADDYTHGSELWVTDGTNTGTHMVKDINENNDSSTRGSGGGASNLTVVGNKLFFVAFDTKQGISLWKSDGTETGTLMVKDSFSDENETNLVTRYGYRNNYGDFTALNNTLYFKFNDGIHGQELWKSDGSTDGTVMVKDIGSDDWSAPSELRAMNGTLFFWFTDNTTPTQSGLYKTDGTSTGTVLVKAFSSNDFEVSGRGISVDNGKLYIELMNYTNGYTKEYWVSDGSSVGTFKLVDGESLGGES